MPIHHDLFTRKLSAQATYRWMVLVRLLTAFMGGYILTAYITSVLTQVIALPRAEAVVLSALLSYLWFCLIVVWVFSVRSTAVACYSVIIAVGCFAGLDYVLQSGWMS